MNLINSDKYQDCVSLEPLTEAVNLQPCAHKVNEDTAKNLFGSIVADKVEKQNVPCPLCRKVVTSYQVDHAYRELVKDVLGLGNPKEAAAQAKPAPQKAEAAAPPAPPKQSPSAKVEDARASDKGRITVRMNVIKKTDKSVECVLSPFLYVLLHDPNNFKKWLRTCKDPSYNAIPYEITMDMNDIENMYIAMKRKDTDSIANIKYTFDQPTFYLFTKYFETLKS